ncbi:MAG: hypothetical protein HYS18_14515 [Burkholderiales bacterium]|nr:hypothetical protein [Burkholderiales bacterium]
MVLLMVSLGATCLSLDDAVCENGSQLLFSVAGWIGFAVQEVRYTLADFVRKLGMLF